MIDLYSKPKLFTEKKIEKGELIFSKGERSQNVYLLNKGKICCFLLSSDKRIVPVFTLVNEGIFCEDAVLSKDGICEYYATSLEECTVTLIPKGDVSNFVKESSNWVKNILQNISARVQHTVDIIGEHKILDSRLNGDAELSQSEEKLILNSIKG